MNANINQRTKVNPQKRTTYEYLKLCLIKKHF
jgi:hypothetical protein